MSDSLSKNGKFRIVRLEERIVPGVLSWLVGFTSHESPAGHCDCDDQSSAEHECQGQDDNGSHKGGTCKGGTHKGGTHKGGTHKGGTCKGRTHKGGTRKSSKPGVPGLVPGFDMMI